MLWNWRQWQVLRSATATAIDVDVIIADADAIIIVGGGDGGGAGVVVHIWICLLSCAHGIIVGCIHDGVVIYGITIQAI